MEHNLLMWPFKPNRVVSDSYMYLTTDVFSVVSQVSAPSLLAKRPKQHVFSLFPILKLV